jgi:predicted DNA-binding protein (UPF0251 family)
MQPVHGSRSGEFHDPNLGITGLFSMSSNNNGSSANALRSFGDVSLPSLSINGKHAENEFLFQTDLTLNGNSSATSSAGNLAGHDAQPLAPTTFDELFQHFKSSLPSNPLHTDFLSATPSDVGNPMNPFRFDVHPSHQSQPQTPPQSSPNSQNLLASALQPIAKKAPGTAPIQPQPVPISSEALKFNPKPNEEILGQIIQKKMNEHEEYIDVAPYVTLPQHEAAKKLGIPSSTLSKKWKDATVNRKWPYRALAKIDKEITTLMHNIPRNSTDGTPVCMDPELEEQLTSLLKKRQQEARSVIIRLN